MNLRRQVTPMLLILTGGVASISAAILPATAEAGLSASFGAANLYLFRGLNFSDSAPQVHGSIDYTAGGFYGGIWGSSESERPGTGTNGQEYDLYIGYAGESSGFSYDVNFTAYEYPQEQAINGGNSLGDASELIISLGFSGVGLSIIDGLNSTDYKYFSLGYDIERFGALVGINDDSDSNEEYTHLDLNFYATEALTFTLSTVVDDDPEGLKDHDTLFVVNWSKSFDL